MSRLQDALRKVKEENRALREKTTPASLIRAEDFLGRQSIEALRGVKSAAEGTVQMLRHPIQTAQGIAEALRNPKESLTAMSTQLQQDFKDSPTKTLFENLTPLPGPSALRSPKADIIVPETLALPNEKKGLTEAKKYMNALRAQQAKKGTVPSTSAQLNQERSRTARLYDGWFMAEDGRFYRDIEPTKADFKFLQNMGDREVKPLYDLDPELATRYHANAVSEPVVRRLRGTPKEGGSYSPYHNLITVKGEDPYWVRNTLDHENVHAGVATTGGSDPFLGTAPASPSPDDFQAYLDNPGERWARMGAIKRDLTPEQRDKIKFPDLVQASKDYYARDRANQGNYEELKPLLLEVLRRDPLAKRNKQGLLDVAENYQTPPATEFADGMDPFVSRPR